MTQPRNDTWRKTTGTDRWKTEGEMASEAHAAQERAVVNNAARGEVERAADRWAEEQLFEEDVRAVLLLMRPNRRERLAGWKEYRTGGAHFRATISWDEAFETADAGAGKTRVPNIADVLEALLVGSARHEDDMPAEEEFEIYRNVLREVYRRLDELQACYE
jgi:hypothetical protein